MRRIRLSIRNPRALFRVAAVMGIFAGVTAACRFATAQVAELDPWYERLREELGQPHVEQPGIEEPRLTWRTTRLPRIDRSPDPARITVRPDRRGWAWVLGVSGATADHRARMVRVVNLRTGDEAFTLPRRDGSFSLRLFAPPGSSLQITTSMLDGDEMPLEIWQALQTEGQADFSEMSRDQVELLSGRLAGHFSNSPGTILPVTVSGESARNSVAFVKKVGPRLWYFGMARLSTTTVSPGDSLRLEIELSVVLDEQLAREFSGRPISIHLGVHSLFDEHGRQRSPRRMSASHVLTPTGLPIETHSELAAHPRPDGGKIWSPAGPGWPIPHHVDDRGIWQVDGNLATIRQTLSLEVPTAVPSGWYGLRAHIHGVGHDEYDAGEFTQTPWYIGFLKVGNAGPPQLVCMLLGSSGPGGSRGVIAREDQDHIGINPRNVFMPEKLVVPRDDAYTGKPITYSLDPYVPLLSCADRPWPLIPAPCIPLDLSTGILQVAITTPDGRTETLGPAELSSAQNDLSVLRPDYVIRGRVIPPVPPTYGNPSLSDIYHLTGRGAFDYRFSDYGHYVIKLDGWIEDFAGTLYSVAGTYDVDVARPLDLEIFPEPGTPLYPDSPWTPQARVFPAVPAQIEFHWRHYPGSDASRMRERRICGTANRWGVFAPDPTEAAVHWEQPGEYVCDVTARYKAPDGTLWMATRRGASIVATPDSDVVVHGERGNRSPTARWRARWFLAGDNRFVAPPSHRPHPPEDAHPNPFARIDLGHTCYPYESGDVAWLGHTIAFSLFPNLTFEDRAGSIARLLEQRWPGVRRGEGREGLYPYQLLPEDRRAIGELPYASMTYTGLPPIMSPADIDQWGYFYTTSWRPGVGVRSQVSEDMFPTGYWFFDDPYGYQLGNGAAGDRPGDVKMNYGGGVFRDLFSGITHYGAYASMLVLLGDDDRLGSRVLPPFDGLLPGSPPCGPLVELGGKRYDVFLTFGAVGPGTILEVGDSLSIAGVVWPPVSGHVEGTFTAPAGQSTDFRAPSQSTGMFHHAGPIADQPGVWRIRAEGVCSGPTSVGTISEILPPEQWPRGGGIGLVDSSFPVPVVAKGTPPIAFDMPPGSRARPPQPLIVRGHLPRGHAATEVYVMASLLGQVVDHRVLPVRQSAFQYAYDPERLSQAFPNIDTRIEIPGPFEYQPAWCDTVILTFWAGQRETLTAGTVVLQGEDVFAHTSTGAPMPVEPLSVVADAPERWRRRGPMERARNFPLREAGAHSSLLMSLPASDALIAGHPWAGEVVRMEAVRGELRVVARAPMHGEVRSVAVSPDGRRIYAALADKSQVVVLDAKSLGELARFEVDGEPRAVLSSPDGQFLFVADFHGNRVLKLNAATGVLQASSEAINRPACLAVSSARRELYTVSFRTGEVVTLDFDCRLIRRLEAPSRLNQCRTLTVAHDGLLYAPQTRADTVVGGQTFDRTVFPVIAVADPQDTSVKLRFFPDLLVVPPHRPVEIAVGEDALYLASAGSDDVLAIDTETGFAKWHAQRVGLEPGAIVLDASGRRLFVLTITGQEIVTLDPATGNVLGRVRFVSDPTPAKIAWGRYLFGTATDKRLTKDQWMSCAVCHPDGDTDGLQWDLGSGPLDTRSLRGCLQTAPLHLDAHLDEIQDTFHFTRSVMAGQWFVPREKMHDWLGPSNAGLDADLDALAAYIASLMPRRPPLPSAASESLIARGREIFFSSRTGCSQCHPPPWYTDSGQRNEEGEPLLHDVGTWVPGEPERFRRLDTPSLLGLDRSDPYLHDGRAPRLADVFIQFNHDDKHGQTSHLGLEDLHALAEFLRYLAPPSSDVTRQKRSETGDR